MSKLRALLVGATAAGALAAGSFAPAFAETINVEDTVIIENDGTGGSITVQGDEGYLTASGDATAPQDGDICGESATAGEGGCVSDLLPV